MHPANGTLGLRHSDGVPIHSSIAPAAASVEHGAVKASIWFGFGLYFNTALIFLATPVFTRLMSQEEYGTVVLYNAWLAVLTIFATLSLSSGVFNNAMLDFKEDVEGYIYAMLGLSAATVAACMAIVVGLAWHLGEFTGLGWSLIIFMFAWFPCNAALLFWQTKERFYYRYRKPVTAAILCSLLGVGCSILLLTRVPAHHVEVRVVIVALPNMLLGGYLFILGTMKGRSRLFSKRYWAYALTFSLPLLPHYIAQSLLQQFDKLLMGHYLEKADVAHYGLAFSLATVIPLLCTAIHASWTPWVLRKLNADDFEPIGASAFDLTVVVGLVCVSFSALAPEIVSLVAPATYSQAAQLVPLLTFACFLQFVQSLFLTAQFFHKRVLWIAQCSLYAAGLNIAINVLFLKLLGPLAGALAAIVCQTMQLAFHFFSLKSVAPRLVAKCRRLSIPSVLVALSIALVMGFLDNLQVRGSVAIASAFVGCTFLLLKVRKAHAFGTNSYKSESRKIL